MNSQKLIEKLKSINPWHSIWILVLVAEVLTLVGSVILCMLIWGEVPFLLLLVGAISVFLVSMMIVALVIYFIRQNNKLVNLNKQLFREIDERKQIESEKLNLEKQLQQSQKMEAIGTLAGGIAHDFNNILSIILGYAEMLQSDIRKETPAAKKLDQIIDAGDRATDLVKQILIFSRQVEEELIPLHVDIIVKETLKMLRAAIPSTIEISRLISQDNMTVLASPTQIHQIMMNLCTNAYQAIGDDEGKITVSLSSVDIGEEELGVHEELPVGGKYIVLEVRDTGEGIRPENLDRIFDPYFTTKSKEEGTGLGLSVVHGIVKSLKGEITVDSVPGQGTSFKLYLPFHPVSASLRYDRESGHYPGGNEKILLVDDEEELVEMVQMMLQELGYQVKPFTCAVDALYEFKRNADTFDLVITDLTMPGLTGDQFSRDLLKIKPTIPIILCTGFKDKISEETARKIGIRKLFLKPFQAGNLAMEIRHLLDTRSN